MKDKEKQIEEMAKIIDDRLIDARGWLGSMNRGEGYWIAQKLVEHYQPKLPEDSVVLSKEEYEKYQNLKRDVEHSFEYNQGYIDGQIKGNKETAEKILNEIFCFVDERDKICRKYRKETFSARVAYDKLKIELYELAKQFGVEIKES